MPVFAFSGNRVHAYAVVTDTYAEILRITQLHLQPASLRVHVGVSDGFVSDAVNLVTDDGVHLPGLADNREHSFHGAGHVAVFRGPAKSIGKIVFLRS